VIAAGDRLHVLFVATVGVGADGETGGQAVTATTLFESGLRRRVELELLSTATPSVPPPGLPRRVARALVRLSRFVVRLWAADVVLVFAADVVSLLEKGVICIFSRLARRGVVLQMSGGNVPAQCERWPVLRAWLRLVLRSPHVVCTQSAYWTTYYSRHVDHTKIVEITNGARLGAPVAPHPPGGRIVFVGWVTGEKGVFEALEVLADVRTRHPSATLTVVGGGRDLDTFSLDVERRGLTDAVQITGWLGHDDVQRTLRESDVFLFPSHFEGLPNAVIEAMAAGLPVVATRVGGVPDLIRPGENGFLVDVGDVAGMTKRIDELLAEPDRAREIGRRGRETVLEQCDIERVWPRFADVLRTAATRAGRGTGVERA
jgi:glycosyltransferase involved in cell wall biosynthesis